MDPINVVVVGVADDGRNPVHGLSLGDVGGRRECLHEGSNGLLELGNSAVVQTLDAGVALAVIRNAEVDLAGHDVTDVLLNGLETGDGGLLGPAERDAEPDKLLGRRNGPQLPGSDDTKVGASTLEAPQQVGVLGARGLDDAAISQDDSGAIDEVGGKAVHVGAEAEAAVKEVSRNTDTAAVSGITLL